MQVVLVVRPAAATAAETNSTKPNVSTTWYIPTTHGLLSLEAKLL
jgi:hypothetical protein